VKGLKRLSRKDDRVPLSWPKGFVLGILVNSCHIRWTAELLFQATSQLVHSTPPTPPQEAETAFEIEAEVAHARVDDPHSG
jgi:hypothetical protein